MTEPSTSERWLNIIQAHTEAGVSRRTIYNWLAAGRLVTKRTAGGGLRILDTSLFRSEPAPVRES